MAAFDCSTKSRAREIPRSFSDGRPAPKPLRSNDYPLGLPSLQGEQRDRVDTDNAACAFILDEIQALRDRGGIAIRENPLRSLHWELPQEHAMMASGQWHDLDYAACVFAGARCKMQRLRHNVEEFDSWPPLRCHHLHDPKEWEPWEEAGRHVYPSKSEAEYTAPLAFSIAVAASWWAVRTGVAILHVPRAPAIECVGDRTQWLQLDPKALREWAMTPLAITLGLEPLDPVERSRIPRRVRVQEVLSESGSLPDDCIYVGLGHHSHRLPVTVWKSPFIPGHNCTFEEWLILYVDHIHRSDLWDQLHTLQGKRLACDCAWQDTCEADMLAGLCFDASQPDRPRAWLKASGRPQDNKPLRRVSLAATVSQAKAQPRAIPQNLFQRSQEAIILLFQKLFPADWLQSFRFPMIEDLINQPPFGLYESWLEERGSPHDGPLPPALAPTQVRLRQRANDGQQAGAFNQRAALPPLLPFGLSVDDHFQQARTLGKQCLPTEQAVVLDPDLHFAAYVCGTHRGDLRSLRTRSMGVLKELHRRWQGVTLHLRRFQSTSIQATTSQRDIGFIALLIAMTSWSDTAYPWGLIKGLPAVGFAPCYGIFPELQVNRITFDEVMGDWRTHNNDILRSLHPGRDDAFLLNQSCLDADKGFCTYPLTWSELQSRVKGQPFRLIPRCVITQASGKQRVIDDAAKGGQSDTSRDSNKLVLCTALRPAQHAQALLSAMTVDGRLSAQAHDSLESGGEDWPDAYRHSPMSHFESRHCVVTFWHMDWNTPTFQLYGGLLFGLPLAVTSFNRFSRLSEALGRRLCYTLVTMYFDDAHITDWASSKGSGQQAFSLLNQLMGSPFADEKRQLMQPQGTFLGLDHDFTNCLSSGVVTFWAKGKLVEKLQHLIQSSLSSEKLPPGVASKIYGLANFFEQGIFGRIGNGGLHAIKLRQYEQTSVLTSAIRDCFSLLQTVLRTQPKRQFPIVQLFQRRFCAASDAALEEPRCGTGGFLLLWFDSGRERREAFYSIIPDALYDLWTPGDKKIAQLELVQVLFALASRANSFRQRRGLWFIDNLAALMALVRGRSESPDLERLSHLIHLACFALKTWIYWEYIPSKSNWADAISRLGFADPWHQHHGFTQHYAYFPTILWDLPLPAITLVFEYL